MFWNLINEKDSEEIIHLFKEKSQIDYFKDTKYIEQELVEKYKSERPKNWNMLYPLLHISIKDKSNIEKIKQKNKIEFSIK